MTQHKFLSSIPVSDRRYGYFDILCKVVAIEVEGIDAGLRYDELKAVLESAKNFSSKSKTAQRIRSSLDVLDGLNLEQKDRFRNRTVVQSALTLTCRLVDSVKGKPSAFRKLPRIAFQAVPPRSHVIEHIIGRIRGILNTSNWPIVKAAASASACRERPLPTCSRDHRIDPP
jgi:hypothetical protein